jgi:hypothetical protein
MQCPTHTSKLEKLVAPQNEVCELCGRPASLSCKSCQFYQCGECRICTQRHNLIKIVELNVSHG